MLQRKLGLLSVFSVASGAMISSGLFVLPGLAFAKTGPSVILAYFLAGLLNIPAMFAQAELSTAMPRSGGSYFVVERSLGAFAGTLAGLISWLCIGLKAAFACVGMGALILLINPAAGELAVRLGALATCLVFTALNLVSVKGTGRAQNVLVGLLVASLVFFVLGGAPAVAPRRFALFFAGDWRAFLAVTGMVFVSYGGLTKVVDVSEEVENPRRNIPLGMFLAFGVVNVLYVAVVFVTVGVLEPARLAGSLAPLAEGAAASTGATGAAVVALGAFLAYATTANAGILAASRSPLAMSRDGLAPGFLARTHARFGTPVPAILITSVFMALVIAFLSVEELAKTASTMFLISFALLNAAVVVMRRAGMQGYQPSFRMPLCPWLPLAGIAVYAFIIFDMGTTPLLLTAAFLGTGSLWYGLYVQRRVHRESAIVYLARAAVSKQFKRSGLEDELIAVALERDNIQPDRFDEIVRGALVLDLPEAATAMQLFERLAAALSRRLNIPSERLLELFIARERESSTEIRPGLAIPHVIIEGHDLFELALVRSLPGVRFSELGPPVRAAFVLAGTSDQRQFHLKALVAIAHIVQEEGFEDRWMNARNAEQLRDIVLLSRRRRTP
ncbi:MAG: amino acid permease [Lentisphaerae bacterium]|nr:amino acid permease [Lentisphaerota bacterium]